MHSCDVKLHFQQLTVKETYVQECPIKGYCDYTLLEVFKVQICSLCLQVRRSRSIPGWQHILVFRSVVGVPSGLSAATLLVYTRTSLPVLQRGESRGKGTI